MSSKQCLSAYCVLYAFCTLQMLPAMDLRYSTIPEEKNIRREDERNQTTFWPREHIKEKASKKQVNNSS